MAAARRIELFYDVVSPYSYFAFEVLMRLQPKWGVNVVLRPCFLGGVMQSAGNKPPITLPARAVFMPKDISREAKLLGLPLAIPANFPANTLTSMRMLVRLYLDKDQDALRAATRELYRAYWGRGEDISTEPVIAEALRAAGLSAERRAALAAAASTDEVKQALKACTQEVVDKGAFGAPTMIVYKDAADAGEFFFGSDRLHHVATYLGVQPLTAHL